MPEYGPGLSGWPAHGYGGTSFSTHRCYCEAEFTSFMALNRHIEAAAVAAALDALAKKVAAEVSSNPEGMNHPTSAFTTGWNRALAAVLAAIKEAKKKAAPAAEGQITSTGAAPEA